MENTLLAPKVAIPRLGHKRNFIQNWPRTSRAQKACDNCRKRKVKCTSEQSHCQNCLNEHVPCVYSKSRNDRLKEVTEQNSQLIALLKDLTARVDNRWQRKIDELLNLVRVNSSAPVSAVAQEPLRKRSRDGSTSEGNRGAQNPGRTHLSGSIGLNGDILVKEEAGIDHCHSFTNYPMPSNTAFPSHVRDYDAQNEWSIPSFNDGIANAKFDHHSLGAGAYAGF